jgi:predicted RNase H-like HicB family nuclease
MGKMYIAAFMPAEEGGWDIVLPDVPGAFTCADTLEEAYMIASEVLALMLRDLAGDKKPLPEPSDLVTVREKTAGHLQTIDHRPAGEILYQLIPAPNLDQTPVKVTISLPKAVLDAVDANARCNGMTRSGFLARAAEEYQEGKSV